MQCDENQSNRNQTNGRQSNENQSNRSQSEGNITITYDQTNATYHREVSHIKKTKSDNTPHRPSNVVNNNNNNNSNNMGATSYNELARNNFKTNDSSRKKIPLGIALLQ